MKYLRNLFGQNGIWQHRRLLWRLTINDMKTKYNNTVLGFIWSLLNPILTMLVLYFIFINFRSREPHYALFLLTGIISYRFFTQGSSATLRSIIAKSSIVENYAIPREILVLSAALSSFISFFLEFTVLVPLVMIVTGVLSWFAFVFPLIHIIYFLFIYGLGLLLASIYPYFRDLGQIWSIVTQLGFFACPIIYSIDILPENILPYYMLNPIANFIIMYREIIISGEMPGFWNFLYVILAGVIIVFIGSLVFKHLQRRFVEVI